MPKPDTKAWLIVLLGILAITAIPFAFYASISGEFLPTILPQLEQDTLYYLTQVRELFDGHSSLGNPYIRDHADDHFPGLLLSMKLAAIPGLFGLGINMIFAVNLLLYSLLTGALLFVICRKMHPKHPLMISGLAVLGVAIMHVDLMRPIMQTIYPSFILFMMALLWVLDDLYDRKRAAALGAITVVSFYMYPYFWMTAFTAVGLLFLRSIFQRDWKAVRLQLLMIVGITLLCIPQILAIVALFYDEVVRELNLRIGLVQSHFIMPLTWWNMKYCIATTLGLLLLSTRRKLSSAEWMVLMVGGAMWIGSMSNVISGKAMDFETHFWRLSLPWSIIALAVLAKSFAMHKQMIQRLVTGTLCTLLFLTTLNRAAIRSNSFAYLHRRDAIAINHHSVKAYEPVFAFLNSELQPEQVILSADAIGVYIPLYTSHYLLYEVKAFLHTIPNAQLMTRFLVHNVDRVDDAFLRSNAHYATGIAPTSTAKYHRAQGKDVTFLDFVGGDAFIEKALSEHQKIDREYDAYLEQFDVTYVLIDNLADRNPRIPRNTQDVYSDERFTLYALER